MSVASRPELSLVSVVMPVRNGARYIGEQLTALAAQSYHGPWELVVADNRCTDRTVSVVERFRSALPVVRLVEASTRVSLNHARNVGAAAAAGELLAFCDADDVADRDWLAALRARLPAG